MPARLPPELLAHILTLACQAKPAPARQVIRHAFRLVCRDWCRSVNAWAELAVVGPDELRAAAQHLLRAQSRPAVRAVFIDLVHSWAWKVPVAEVVRELNRFLRLVDAVERLEVRSTREVLSRASEWPEDYLTALQPRTLGRLTRLRSISLVGDPSRYRWDVPVQEIRRLTASCSALKALELKNMRIVNIVDSEDPSLIAPSSRITSLTLVQTRNAITNSPLAPILPPQTGLTALAIKDRGVYAQDFLPCDDIARSLTDQKETLQHLSLLDPADPSSVHHPPYGQPLDRLGPAIEQHVNVRTLELSPVVTGNLECTLAPLTKLENLSIIQGSAPLMTAPTAAAICSILNGPAPLRRVAISAELFELWSEPDQRQVAAAALRKGIAFVKL